MSETPQDATPVTGIEESDPNADGPEGLAGDMGVSSERKGPVRGQTGEVTYGSPPTHTEDEPGETPPEQSASDGRPDANPDSPGAHESDPDSNPRHGV
ncbi:MAG: hypothetical protein JWR90_1487 [Marmoricola sp.]|nr:hypothetical protein [Marmoricola sp.]